MGTRAARDPRKAGTGCGVAVEPVNQRGGKAHIVFLPLELFARNKARAMGFVSIV